MLASAYPLIRRCALGGCHPLAVVNDAATNTGAGGTCPRESLLSVPVAVHPQVQLLVLREFWGYIPEEPPCHFLSPPAVHKGSDLHVVANI